MTAVVAVVAVVLTLAAVARRSFIFAAAASGLLFGAGHPAGGAVVLAYAVWLAARAPRRRKEAVEDQTSSPE